MNTDRLLEIAEKTEKKVMKHNVDQTEITVFLVDESLTRYANSQIHQNVSANTGGVAIKIVVDNKIGTIQANSLEMKQIEDAIGKALQIAKLSPPNSDFKSLPEPSDWKPIEGTFDVETAECNPYHRAERVKEVIDTAHSVSPSVKAVAGSYSTESIAFAIVNSLGVSAWTELTLASIKATVISKSGLSQGFSSEEKNSRTITDINPVDIARKAAERSIRSINPEKIEVGEYEVVLSQHAVAGLFLYLGYIGFSARSYQEGQSFINYNLNKQVFDKKLNVIDDSRDPDTLFAIPFDGEGVPKKKMQLIADGIVTEKSLCYDSFTGGKEGKESTGHSLPRIWGYFNRPLPFNVLVEAGDSSIDEMVEDTKHGIYVTRFHYTNPVEPTKAILTGLTRDGTFLIEDGEIIKPIYNLRYTDSLLSAFSDIPMMSKKRKAIGNATTPAMKLRKLRFTGITKY